MFVCRLYRHIINLFLFLFFYTYSFLVQVKVNASKILDLTFSAISRLLLEIFLERYFYSRDKHWYSIFLSCSFKEIFLTFNRWRWLLMNYFLSFLYVFHLSHYGDSLNFTIFILFLFFFTVLIFFFAVHTCFARFMRNFNNPINDLYLIYLIVFTYFF